MSGPKRELNEAQLRTLAALQDIGGWGTGVQIRARGGSVKALESLRVAALVEERECRKSTPPYRVIFSEFRIAAAGAEYAVMRHAVVPMEADELLALMWTVERLPTVPDDEMEEAHETAWQVHGRLQAAWSAIKPPMDFNDPNIWPAI